MTVEQKLPIVASPLPGADPCLWIARFDPRRFALELISGPMAEAKTAADWLSARGLVAVINAAMYAPSGRPTGFAMANDKVIYDRVHGQYGAFLAFGPRKKGLPPVTMASPRCKGFDLDRLRRDYGNIVQNYRLLDCDGKPVSWKDPRPHSAAAVALDRRGRVVFLHVVAPYRMEDFSRVLADPELGLVAAMFVEGGAPAQLSLRHGKTRFDRVGGFEALRLHQGLVERLPNVLGIRAR